MRNNIIYAKITNNKYVFVKHKTQISGIAAKLPRSLQLYTNVNKVQFSLLHHMRVIRKALVCTKIQTNLLTTYKCSKSELPTFGFNPVM